MYKLREITREDLEVINIWRTNKNLIRDLGAPFRFINRDIENKWYDNYISNRDLNIRCSIIDKENHLIGLVSLLNINKLNQSAIFHIMIGEEKNTNKGAGYFAINEILKHAFLDINLNRVELDVLESNERAIRLYNKVGFVKEGMKREALYKNGKFINCLTMSILKSEFIYKEIK